ncbi:MAG: hypothetical protein A2Y50_03785 [Pseudomonadales bacterium RIFCSPLOWO2_12_59_9]|nr:MAG: hypothetical protein A2Y50_03785 [Pseudomonadales bacterium RIFCSPLOWO2_12_59_9]
MELISPGMAPEWLMALLLTALFAGYMDAIAGGGGIIQVPILLLSGMSPIHVLATNKAIALMGTASATVRYMLSGRIVWRVVRIVAVPCILAAFLGSQLAMITPDWILELSILACLLVALLVALLVKTDGEFEVLPRLSGRRIIANLVPVGLYDGFSGPGTGVFLMLVNHVRLKLDLLSATATTKPINLIANLGGVVAFVLASKVIWAVAIPMILANSLGGWLGSHWAIKKGAPFIRVVLLMMLVALTTMTVWKFTHAFL